MGNIDASRETMHILVTIDEGYIPPFKVLAKSVAMSNRDHSINFILVHSSIRSELVSELQTYCAVIGAFLTEVKLDPSQFGDAPTTRRYPLEVYFRLLAPHILPPSIDRVIYLDCDILVINSLVPLWEMDLYGMAFAAASHSGEKSPIDWVNQMRLGTDHEFFNTGVLVMDVARAREVMTLEKLVDSANGIGRRIILPDQDVFNIVCGECCLRIDDEIWNYDAYVYPWNLAKSRGRHDVDWVMENVSVLHFCWPHKPWKVPYAGRFGALYKHYMQLAERETSSIRKKGGITSYQ